MNARGTREKQIVAKARQGFGNDLFAQDYHQIHGDDQHLNNLLDMCQYVPGRHYLDLGTGNGYLAFAIAGRSPDSLVTGIDIVSEAAAANNQKARREGNKLLNFVSYSGIRLPFADQRFVGVLTRYAFHHFPNARLAAQEIARVLTADGFCLIADPAPHETDRTGFINQFASLKDDGHVRFYPGRQLATFFTDTGFKIEAQSNSAVTFPRKRNSQYMQLIEQTPQEILAAYQLHIKDENIYVTVPVLNTLFRLMKHRVPASNTVAKVS